MNKLVSTNDDSNLPLITNYGSHFIKIHNNRIENNVLLFSNGEYKIISDLVNGAHSLNIVVLGQLLDLYKIEKDILLVGCGHQYIIPDFHLRSFINKSGFCLEWMVTKSAIHTWNLLLEDYRNVCCLLLWND